MSQTNGQPLPSNSWIQFNSAAQEINAFLYVDILDDLNTKQFNFILTATNSFHRSKNSMVTIECKRNIFPLGGVKVDITGTEYFNSIMTDIQVLTILLQRYFQYTGKRDRTEVISFSRSSGVISTFKITLMYHRIDESNICDIAKINVLRKKLLTPKGTINYNLITAFLSEAVGNHVMLTNFGVCLNLPSTTAAPMAPQIINPIPTLVISNAGFFQYAIPKNTFFDAKDGFTPSLQLQLLDRSGNPVDINSWLTLSTNQVLIMSPSKRQFLFDVNLKFTLRAINKQNLYIDMQFSVSVTTFSATNMLQITLSGTHQFPTQSSNVDIIVYIMEKFNSYIYTKTNRKDTLLVEFTRANNRFTIILADKKYNTEICQHVEYAKFHNWLYTSEGQLNPKFVIELYPMVLLTSIDLSPDCNAITTTTTQTPNTPPYVNIPIPQIQIEFGRLIFYYINSDTILDREDGNTRTLTLKLLQENKKEVNINSWVQLHQNIRVIYGFYTVHDFEVLKPTRFFLQATDKMGSSAITPVTFLTPSSSFRYSFKMITVISMFYDASVSLANEQILFVTKMNTLLADFVTNGIQLITFIRNVIQKELIIQFTLDNLNDYSCPYNILNRITTKFIVGTSSSSPSQEYTNILRPEFTIKNIQVMKMTACMTIPTLSPSPSSTLSKPYSSSVTPTPTLRPPIVNLIIPPLYPKQCSVFIYYLPPKVFLDPNNGGFNNINLTLLTEDGKALGDGSWLSFNQQHKYIYGVITADDIKKSTNRNTMVYKLQATNSGGSAHSYITLKLPNLQQIFSSITIIFKTQKTINKHADLTVLIIGKLSTYLKQSNVVRILSVIKMQGQFWTVKFTACENLVTYCNMVETEDFKKNFLAQDYLAKTAFKNFLYPEIELLQGYITTDMTCTLTTKPPISTTTSTTQKPNINLPPNVLRLFTVQSTSLCEAFKYKIPADSFFDNEDGLTENLNIQLKQQNGEKLDADSWITFDVFSQTVQGVLTYYDAVHKDKYIYRVIATDKGGLSVYQYLRIQISVITPHIDGHVIDSYGTIFTDDNKSKFKLLVHQKFMTFLQPRLSGITGILIRSLVIYPTNPKNFNLKWSVCQTVCQPKAVTYIESVILLNGKQINPQFMLSLHPRAQLSRASISGSSRCQPTKSSTPILPTSSIIITTTLEPNTPPVVYKAIPILTIQSCKMFEYQIPFDTCFDKEDGFTSNLKLEILYRNNTQLERNSWIYLNKISQKVYGLLKITDIQESANNVFVYQLMCEDKHGLSVSQMMYIVLKDSPSIPSYHFEMESYIYVNKEMTDSEVQLLWLKKIKQYLRNQDEKIQIVSFERSDILYPKITITWYNCLILNPCSDEAIKLKSWLLNDKNHHSMNEEFSKKMVPEFVLISGRMKQREICPTTFIPPTTTPITTPVNKVPITIIKDLFISMNPCKELIYQIPSNTFFDVEDGYTANLDLSLTNVDGSPLDNLCMTFDKEKQILYSRYVMENFKGGMLLKLIARDKAGASTVSNIMITIQGEMKKSSH